MKKTTYSFSANLEIQWKLPGKVALGKLLWGAMDLSPLNPRVARGSWRDQKLGRKRILGCFTCKKRKFIMEKCGFNGMNRDCRTNGLTTKRRWKVNYVLTKSHKYFANNGKIMHYVILCIKTGIWPCVWDFGCFGTNPIWGASRGILGIYVFLKQKKLASGMQNWNPFGYFSRNAGLGIPSFSIKNMAGPKNLDLRLTRSTPHLVPRGFLKVFFEREPPIALDCHQFHYPNCNQAGVNPL